jgi:hypothetical protein
MSDARRDSYARVSRCGRCKRPVDIGEMVYEPGRYSRWTWVGSAVCRECADVLDAEAGVQVRAEPPEGQQ